MSAFSESRRDKAIANDALAQGDLMCRAHGCPNRWSVDTDGRSKLCSAHAWVDPGIWPQITQQEQDLALMRAQRPTPAPSPALTGEDKRAILAQLRTLAARMRDGQLQP
jgi:hypothetical protein